MRSNSGLRRLALAAVGVFALATGPARAGIHFLAVDDFPQELQQRLARRQQAIIGVIQAHKSLTPALTHLHQNKGHNLHISVVRFKELSKREEAAAVSRIRKVVQHSKFKGSKQRPYNLASKVDGASLHVMDNGWIVFRIKSSETMTHFAHKVIKDVGHQGQTDFPGGAHISVIKVDPKVVAIPALRKALEGHIQPLKCKTFVVHRFRLMHADDHHHYATVKHGIFQLPKGK